ncbi:MAG: radical SAM protein [Alphaproteobacteria bacterium]|nr:radical SAM protein [Alphaproteobacteria bacterium]
MLTQIHVLLTYQCTWACDHCFLYCSPESTGTFTGARLAKLLDQAAAVGTVDWIYFEGGEPFLYYPLLLHGLRMARDRGFKTGIVTNGYWATSPDDAEAWLRPLVALGVSDLSMSDDAFHGGTAAAPVKAAIAAARRLDMPVNVIRVAGPARDGAAPASGRKGATIEGGPVRFRGRAADRLTDGLPRHDAKRFNECPHEDLRTPERVHIDAFGAVQFCQGLSIGNIWHTPLPQLLTEYDADAHPVCGPLLAGGPARLARKSRIAVDEGFVDACHLCFLARRALLDRFPEALTPRQAYGVK